MWPSRSIESALVHTFLRTNRAELIARCKAKVAGRPRRAATTAQLANGIPMFLEQLIRTLQAEEDGEHDQGVLISGPAGGDAAFPSEIRLSARAHGTQLLHLAYSVDQVVHDYGDLCQAITDLAVERDAPFSVNQFRTLNRCLDNAIADAVTAFVQERDANAAIQHSTDVTQALGILAHELRSSLQTATLAFMAIESGRLSIAGSTGTMLKRSLVALSALTTRSLVEVQAAAGEPHKSELFGVSTFIAEARNAACLDASFRGCRFAVSPVDPLAAVKGDRGQLLAALMNLLHNAFRFTQPRTTVTLKTHSEDGHVLVEVIDHCGGLPPGDAKTMSAPDMQRSGDKSGLSIARRYVEADGGTLTVRDRPGSGCVFTMRLPRHELEPEQA